MIDKNLIGLISEKLHIERQEFIEKDILLQNLLFELSKNKYFFDTYAFKGGTCLAKCYMGYYRFSEDLDFTIINGKQFINKSANTARKMISQEIHKLLILFEEIAKKITLDFKAEKGNRQYLELGGGNKFTTFKLGYHSSILNARSFIKIQINFIEQLIYPVKELEAKSLISDSLYKEIKFVYPQYSYLNEKIMIHSYSLEEILVEKVRAILTRRGIKGRDFLDVFLIANKHKIKPEDFKKQIIDKIVFMLKYEKYSINIKAKTQQLDDDFALGKEKNLLLIPIPTEFDNFLKEFKLFLKSIISAIEK